MIGSPGMPRRLLVALLGLAVIGTGPSPCVAAALAKAPAAAAGHRAGHDGMHGGGCHEPATSLAPRCDCGCTSETPRGAAHSLGSGWALVESAADATEPPAPAPAAPPAPLRASAPPARIDHVPIAS